MIRIEGLTILFESFKIVDFNIVIEEREFHSLLGPTGCGKTLILESIMGLHRPAKSKSGLENRRFRIFPLNSGRSPTSPKTWLSSPTLR